MMPSAASIQVIAPRWLIPIEPAHTVLADHAVVVIGDRIAAVLPQNEARAQYPGANWIELPEHALLPGLVNAHTHAAMTLLRGVADDLPLERWLQEAIWPREAALVSPEFVYEGTWLACAEMLSGGITCALDMYFFPEAAARAFHEAGLRAMLGLVALEFPTPYATHAEEYLNKGLLTLDTWQGRSPFLRFAWAPHAPYTVSDATFRRIATLAKEQKLPVHLHLNETAQETPDSVRQHAMAPLERLQRLGLLNGIALIGAHGVHLSAEELCLLGASGAALVHCPTSNLKLASGAANVCAWQEAGVVAALGTDGAASNNRLDLFWEMRHAALLAKLVAGRADVLPAFEVLAMATLGGARALGWENEIGSIRPGKAADLIAVSFADPLTQPVYDPISHLVWVAGREHVTDVWVAGVPKKRDGRLLLQKSDMD